MGFMLLSNMLRAESRMDDNARRKRLRRQHRQCNIECNPIVLPEEYRFACRLLRCPKCGNVPFILKVRKTGSVYEYKMLCCNGNGLECGDWYRSLARAGKSWNERARKYVADQVQNIEPAAGMDDCASHAGMAHQ